MTPTTLRDQLRREVREAVFCACRQRLVGAPATADDWLNTEFAMLRVQHAAAQITEAELSMWQREDEETFAHAKLVSDLVAEQLRRAELPASLSANSSSATAHSRPPVAVESKPLGSVPDVADLLEGMLLQERRARARPA